jgi:TRAP-type C4-dicarboxylate transport system substrate-binding protein
VAKYYTTMGWGSVVAYPLTVNNKTWAKLPESVQNVILSEIPNYEAAIEAESTTKYVTALKNTKNRA